jgi:hypothetical protein
VIRQDRRAAQARRSVEEATDQTLPRNADGPSVWLLPPAELDQLASGRAAR